MQLPLSREGESCNIIFSYHICYFMLYTLRTIELGSSCSCAAAHILDLGSCFIVVFVVHILHSHPALLNPADTGALRVLAAAAARSES